MSSNTKPIIFRRNYVSRPQAQFKIVFMLGSLALITALTIAAVTYSGISQLDTLFFESNLPPAEWSAALKGQAMGIMYKTIALLGLMIIAFIGLGFFLTHNVTGPIVKLINELNMFFENNGQNSKPIRFRTSDEFQELPPLINKLIEGYKKP